jgi:signal peptidase I
MASFLREVSTAGGKRVKEASLKKIAGFAVPPQVWLAAEILFLLFIAWQLWDFELFLLVMVPGKLILALILLLRGVEHFVKEGKAEPGPQLKRILEVLSSSKLLYAILVLAFAGYLLSKSVVFGYLVALAILLLVAEEIVRGVAEGGLKSELRETRIAIYFALGLWFGAGFLLQTTSPINAIVSCSMLPAMERGDLVLLHGGEVNAPAVLMSDAEAMMIGKNATVQFGNRSIEVKGSMYAHCVLNRNDRTCAEFIATPEGFVEKNGPLEFRYSKCERYFPGSGASNYGPCVTSIYYNGEKVTSGKVGDTVVYAPKSGDLFARSGDIIHRVFLEIETPKTKYYVIKGDNNPVADLQVYDSRFGGNSIAEGKQLKGRVLFRIPMLGYFKLFLSGFVEEGESCNSYLKY